jgi:phospholipid/cholesterol/gamma-HCH transport system substrate-binding protein
VNSRLPGALWRFTAFVAVCALGTFALVMVFGQLRFGEDSVYRAEFTNISGLEEGNFVRIAGVEVGKVKHISITPNTTVTVEFSTDDNVLLTEGTRAAIRYDNVIGGRYMELLDGAGDVKPLAHGQIIPTSRTEPALDLDALIGGFRPLFRALNPDQVNALSGQLIQALQGQGATVSSFLAETASLTNTLADHDDLIGQVITNLNTVLGSLAGQSGQLGKALDALSEIVAALADRKADVTNAVANTNAASGTIADLLAQARAPIKDVVHNTDRAAGIVVADHDYFDDVLNTLPDSYRVLARQGLYGDYFSFYLCELILKVNGKGGQPVYIKVAGQDSGRCAPR